MSDTVLPWYTRRELAERWKVAEKTVSNWLSLARARGHGPTTKQYRREQRRNAGGCRMLVRADYANALFERRRGGAS